MLLAMRNRETRTPSPEVMKSMSQAAKSARHASLPPSTMVSDCPNADNADNAESPSSPTSLRESVDRLRSAIDSSGSKVASPSVESFTESRMSVSIPPAQHWAMGFLRRDVASHVYGIEAGCVMVGGWVVKGEVGGGGLFLPANRDIVIVFLGGSPRLL